jgi:hypothetical protein
MKHKITLLLVAVFTTVVTAQTVKIDGTTYPSISEAIAAASDGDVIDITGTHTESIDISKAITLRGTTDPSTDIIQAAATQGAATSRVIVASGDKNITIENLTVQNGNSAAHGGGIFADKVTGLLTLDNVIITNNTTAKNGGGISTGGSNVNFNDCTISNNSTTANGTGGGIHIVPNNGAAIDAVVNVKNSVIHNNSTLKTGGGFVINGNHQYGDKYTITANFENVTIVSNTAGPNGGAGYVVGVDFVAGGSGSVTTGATNTNLNMVHCTVAYNTITASDNGKQGLTFTNANAITGPNFNIYNSIVVSADDVAKKALNFANSNANDVINNILGGLNAFSSVQDLNNQKGKTATFAGLTGAFTEEGGNTLVLPITYNSNSDDYCTAATGITLPTVDQRGFDRGNTPDAGAYEFSFNSVWNGTTDSDWATASNWSNGVPTTGVAVRIESAANMPTTSSAIDVRNMIMDAGTSFITSSTFAGNLSYTRNLSTDNWYTVSSPVVGETYGDDFVTSNGIASSGENRAIAPYVTSNDSWAYMQAGDESITFISGKGYSVKLASPGAISFTGTMNVDDTSIALTTSGEGFNLIGNPYPSYINSGSILPNSTSALDAQTLWVWNQSTSSYDTKVTVDAFKIAPGQGFFVKSDGAEGSVLIAEADQSHQSTDTFQRTEAKPEIYLTLIDGSASREAKIYFIDNTTTGFDNGYDGEMFGGVANDFAIYTHLVSNSQGKDYAIQSLPRDNYKNIPVGVNAISGTAITIEASTTNFPEGMNIYLEDTSDNSFTLLDAESDFTTTLGSDLNGIGRFYLHTTTGALSTNDVAANNNLSIYTSTRENLRIVGVQNGTANIQLYNILGKKVLKGSFEGNGVNDIALPRLNSGIYIVKIATEKGTINKKIIIQ